MHFYQNKESERESGLVAFLGSVAAGGQTVEDMFRVSPQDDDDVEPPLGEEVGGGAVLTDLLGTGGGAGR